MLLEPLLDAPQRDLQLLWLLRDLDGLFHVAMLQMLVDPSAAMETANRILEVEPDHVLGLGMAAEAAIGLGDDDKAVTHYQHLLEVFDAQVGRPLAEYQGHQQSLTQMQSAARAFLDQRLPHITRLLKDSVEEAVADAEVVIVGHRDARFDGDETWRAQGKVVLRLA